MYLIELQQFQWSEIYKEEDNSEWQSVHPQTLCVSYNNFGNFGHIIAHCFMANWH